MVSALDTGSEGLVWWNDKNVILHQEKSFNTEKNVVYRINEVLWYIVNQLC